MSATFAGWLSGRIESQGLGPKRSLVPPSSTGDLSLRLPESRRREVSGNYMGHVGEKKIGGDESVSLDEVRSSEEGSVVSRVSESISAGGLWRASDESSRGQRVDEYGRRASDGAVKALSELR